MTTPYGVSMVEQAITGIMSRLVLWQFKSGTTGAVKWGDMPHGAIYSAWDRSLGRRVYYQP